MNEKDKNKQVNTLPVGVDITVTEMLAKISSQIERLIICEEKKLSGQVIQNFDSKQHLTNLQGGK